MNVSRRRYMGEKGGSIPYQRIEYLENSGGQYIELNYLDASILRVKVIAQSEKQYIEHDIIGNVSPINNGSFALGLYKDDIYIFNRYTIQTENATIPFNDDWSNRFIEIEALFDVVNSQKWVKVENSQSIIRPCANISNDKYKITIFRSSTLLSSDYEFNGKIKTIQIIKDGQLWFDLYPVRIGTTGYLYDTVSGELFGNNGTGDFILGPDIN